MADNDDQNPDAPADTDDAPKPEQSGGNADDTAKWKALARKHEKESKALADRLRELEDKDKSEVERLTEQVASLTNERDSALSRADRIEVAVSKSLDEDKAKRITSAAKRLTGTTREELEADADEFLTAFALPNEPPRPTPSGKPQEQLKPGNNDPDAPVEETDVRKLGARMFQH